MFDSRPAGLLRFGNNHRFNWLWIQHFRLFFFIHSSTDIIRVESQTIADIKHNVCAYSVIIGAGRTDWRFDGAEYSLSVLFSYGAGSCIVDRHEGFIRGDEERGEERSQGGIIEGNDIKLNINCFFRNN